MLLPTDFHIKQVAVSLGAIERFGVDILKFYKIWDDFKYILDVMNSEFDDELVALDENKLSDEQGAILRLEKNYKNYLSREFLKEYEKIKNEPLNQLIDHKSNHNL